MISVTLLSSYLYCKRKLYLERVLKLVPLPKLAIVRGTINHDAFEKINLMEKSIITSIKTQDFNEIFSIYSQGYSAILRESIIDNKDKILEAGSSPSDIFKSSWPNFIGEARSRAEQLSSFISSTGLFGKELWENLWPKIESEVAVESKHLRLRGIIDKIEHYPDYIVPVELKTGSAPKEGIWPSHKIQLAAYYMMLEPKNPRSAYIHYLDSGEKKVLDINPFLKEQVISTTEKVHLLLDSKILPEKCSNTNKCASCALKQQCFSQR